ncbi:MAG TPA: ParB/RepB/Spo0J family partition protein [Deltaproteobacteria bacterium]|nr:ParB/RepB/Spo0J family partition protein [Deltaproteobacteria bacterium]HPR53945.1 ParB/RepB/Spo0J family partition protein [Deltaproteobacteria bacterium]HXK46745.1 ParB/RepB/Spo0J family partition protein [Deltaproteobacteria bacterium]
MKTRPRLGKGIDALIPFDASAASASHVIELSLDEIRPNPIQPRKNIDQEKLSELAQSIKLHGLISPILVRKFDSRYEIIAGERRFHACRLAGLTQVPVIVKDASDDDSFKLSLIENIQREDLNPMEESEAYATLKEHFGLTHQEIAESVMKDRSTITNALRLLSLPEEMKAALRDGSITPGHARAILMVNTEDGRNSLFQKVVTKGLSVRETELRATKTRSDSTPLSRNDPDLDKFSEQLSELLSARVSCSWSKRKGKITIEISSKEELSRIIRELSRTGSPL